jgi:hypothetical protein
LIDSRQQKLTMAKPHLKQMPKTSDADIYQVTYKGHSEPIVLSGCLLGSYPRPGIRYPWHEVERQAKEFMDWVDDYSASYTTPYLRYMARNKPFPVRA